MFDYETLRVIWWALVGVLLIGFAITDGFDMGVGALLPFVGKKDVERRVMLNTMGPHWKVTRFGWSLPVVPCSPPGRWCMPRPSPASTSP